MALRFDTEFDPCTGQVVELSPLVRRIVAPNPSKFTFHGTGTYLIGRGSVAVVDPGPDMAEHVDALLDALKDEDVTHILVTHTHADHSPASRAVAAATGAPVVAFGPHPPEAVGEGESEPGDDDGLDHQFVPDCRIGHGDVVTGPGWTVEALHTPGHMSNHLCFALHQEKALLSGDHVMGWSSTVIPPPDGDIAAYLRSLRLLLDRDDTVLYPTHGAPRRDVHDHVAALLEHRLEREQQILAELRHGPRTVAEMVTSMYADVAPELHGPAGRSVLAHLLKLRDEAVVSGDRDDSIDPDTVWRLTGRA